MVQAVFFDWFNTLAMYHPSGELLQNQALQENGYTISIESVRAALYEAEKFYHTENTANPIRLRNHESQNDLFAAYETRLLSHIGIDISDRPDIALRIYERTQRLRYIGFALYDDVLPALTELKNRNYTIGVITNIDEDMRPVINGMGLSEKIDVIVTSGEAGAGKPQPSIFNLALKKAAVPSEEAIHVGDQYSSDIVGAKRAGLKPVLIDRNGDSLHVKDCLRIQNLGELMDILG